MSDERFPVHPLPLKQAHETWTDYIRSMRPAVFLVLERTCNANLVVLELRPDRASYDIYWVNMAVYDGRSSKGLVGPLTWLERSMAYVFDEKMTREADGTLSVGCKHMKGERIYVRHGERDGKVWAKASLRDNRVIRSVMVNATLKGASGVTVAWKNPVTNQRGESRF
jgi:hypothetical protein